MNYLPERPNTLDEQLAALVSVSQILRDTKTIAERWAIEARQTLAFATSRLDGINYQIRVNEQWLLIHGLSDRRSVEQP